MKIGKRNNYRFLGEPLLGLWPVQRRAVRSSTATRTRRTMVRLGALRRRVRFHRSRSAPKGRTFRRKKNVLITHVTQEKKWFITDFWNLIKEQQPQGGLTIDSRWL